MDIIGNQAIKTKQHQAMNRMSYDDDDLPF